MDLGRNSICWDSDFVDYWDLVFLLLGDDVLLYAKKKIW